MLDAFGLSVQPRGQVTKMTRRRANHRLESLILRSVSWWGRKLVVNPFHRVFYYSSRETWADTKWLGVPLLKCPFDLWVYQEILEEVRPTVIVECGTAYGGSALYLASICDLLGHGEVITVDMEVAAYPNRPVHDRISYIEGSSTAPETVSRVKGLIAGREPVMVILDSDHSKQHVLEELGLYGPLVSRGSYLIVEDTNVNGHPVLTNFGPGPTEAIAEFTQENSAFIRDTTREKYLLTFNPNGYLFKRAPPENASRGW
jgi:cephalosporin hydroxylase